MTFHDWSEKEFDWDGLNKAGSFIHKYLRRRRVNVMQTKEKYGTLRVYCSLGISQFHNLTHPGHAFIRYNKFWAYLDFKLGIPFFNLPFVRIPIRLYHQHAYRSAYQLALKRWPELREEILCCADWPEYLKGL